MAASETQAEAWSPRRISVGSDHAGVDLKAKVRAHLEARGIAVDDVGTADSATSVDYPDFGRRVAEAVAAGDADAGVLICGTGIGQSIVANKVGGVRAALVTDAEMAEMARRHNNANVLVLGARVLDEADALALLDVYLETPYEGGRHQRRLDKIHAIEGGAGRNIFGAPSSIAAFDPEVYDAIVAEQERQETHLELIASENFASRRVLEATGSVLTNKYAEGYPGKRYYGGCEHVDVVERLAVERAKALFGAEFANVQPHSGSQANMAAYFAMIEPGSRILGMDLSNGGHLTHGAKVNFSGRLYEAHHYGVDTSSGRIDYDAVAAQAREVQPAVIVAGASAYPREIDFAAFKAIADEVGAKLLVDMAHIAGLVAAGVHPSPIAHADLVTTTTHKTLRGPRAGIVMGRESYEKPVAKQVFPGMQGGPLMHVIAAKAVAFKEAAAPEFADYQRQVVANARALAAGLVERGYVLVSGGTDNHLLLLDLSGTEITGKEAERAMGAAGITVNKNTVPNEQRSPFVTSGVRIGTPAVTTRGMREAEMHAIAAWIDQALQARDDDAKLAAIKAEVAAFARDFPLYARGGARKPAYT